jgi:predicted ArsR family transcriptional regulator
LLHYNPEETVIFMEQPTLGQRGPASEILRLLQRRGPLDVKALEAALGVSTNAVREQLQQLLAADLVTRSKVSHGAGRPAHVYALTDKAQASFPQAYGTLVKLLIEEIVRNEDEAAAQRLLDAVGERLGAELAPPHDSMTLRERLDAVIALLDQRGAPVTLYESADVLALQGWSCPFYDLAREHQGLCEMERHMLERALGVPVTIAERRFDGHAGCRFIVEQ